MIKFWLQFRPIDVKLNHQPLSRWLTSLLALLLMLTSTASEATLNATLDRDSAYVGDIITLTIESDSRQSDQQPDLTPLEKNFELLGSNTSRQVSIYNGQRSDKFLWQVQLQARHTGQIRIPPIHVGKQQTQALQLIVKEAPEQTEAQPEQHVFIEVETSSSKQIYVQQQIPYRVRLYYDERLQDGELNAPAPENAVLEQLGEEKRYSSIRNGRQYSVIERNYVISAEKSGSLSIPPASFRGHITIPQPQRQPTRAPRSLMEELFNNGPFANDRFFRNRPFNNPARPIAIRSRAIKLDIKPQPATAQHDWLPAETVSLHDSWTDNPPQFKVGEPISRTLTIQTQGLAGSQIPKLNIISPAHARLYPETPEHESKTDGKSIYGNRSQILTYIATAQGTLEVPAISLNWWDTQHNKAASSTLPGWQFKVLPGAAGTAADTQETNVSQTEPQPAPASETASTREKQIEPTSVTLADEIKSNGLWLLSSGIMLALVLLVVFMARRAKHIPASTQHTKPKQKATLQALKKACAANDKHAAARAMLELGQVCWPDDPPPSLAALTTRIEKDQTPLKELEHSLYAANTGDWDGGAALWNVFKNGLQNKKQRKQNQDDGLKPLYPKPT